jgi:hypothetical protein
MHRLSETSQQLMRFIGAARRLNDGAEHVTQSSRRVQHCDRISKWTLAGSDMKQRNECDEPTRSLHAGSTPRPTGASAITIVTPNKNERRDDQLAMAWRFDSVPATHCGLAHPNCMVAASSVGRQVAVCQRTQINTQIPVNVRSPE